MVEKELGLEKTCVRLRVCRTESRAAAEINFGPSLTPLRQAMVQRDLPQKCFKRLVCPARRVSTIIFLHMSKTTRTLVAVSLGGMLAALGAGAAGLSLDISLRSPEPNAVSPVRKINRQPPESTGSALPEPGFRSIDGSGNNLASPSMSAANTRLKRVMNAAFDDGVSQMSGSGRPNPRAISNAVSAQDKPMPNPFRASNYLWQWGQFLDHDLSLTDGVDPPEPADIPIPTGDPFFDPDGTGTAVMTFNRSIHDVTTGTGADNPREQMNEITAWIDASNVYGSDATRAAALRTNDGTGRLRTSEGDLLPFNTDGLSNAGGDSPDLFLAGDVRANEQVGLTAMHTLFVREHNRLADIIRAEDPLLSGDEIYERARWQVGAQMQVITYEEFLPVLLGADALALYAGYRPEVDASMMSVFSTACFRLGHSLLSPTLTRLDADGAIGEAGHLSLAQAFFAPHRIIGEGGIEPLLRGLAAQRAQTVDPFVIDEVRNFLFGEPGSGGFDLVTLNIQRGRDHGLPAYNDVRAAFGLDRKVGFDEVSSDPEIRKRLAAAYAGVDVIDPWVGGLAEDPVPGAQVGELIFTVLRRQFEELRDGDRFWYERTFAGEELAEIRATRLSDIIRRNTTIGDELPDDVFKVAAAPSEPRPETPPSGTPRDSGGSGSLGWFGALALLLCLTRRARGLPPRGV
ncbi:hypothetical protein BH24PSE2_BH24PSE2_06510 [soil metagenome]